MAKLSNILRKVILILMLIVCSQCQSEVHIPKIGKIFGTQSITNYTGQEFHKFVAIPYALAPIGDRRFKAPVPYATDSETDILANRTGRVCPSYARILDLPPEQQTEEDCLHLSVYSKNLKSKSPVMFFIHGGALDEGDSIMYQPGYLLEKDIVLVVIQYRLGPLGFLATGGEIKGNMGFEDTILALKWTKLYINYFGGDPNEITIFGESAGSLLVSTLVLSPNVTENLFQRAIMQSGSYFGAWAYDANPLETAKGIMAFTSCDESEEIDNCFKRQSTHSLITAYGKYKENKKNKAISYSGTSHLVTNDVLPIPPEGYSEFSGTWKNISVMIGANKYDGSFIALDVLWQLNGTIGLNNPEYNKYQLLDRYLQMFDTEDTTGAISGYLETLLFSQESMKGGDIEQMYKGFIDIASTFTFKSPALKTAQLLSKQHPGQTYFYSFDYEGEHNLFKPIDTSNIPPIFLIGAQHAYDLMYLFPLLELNEKDTRMSKTMIDLWTSFAINGIPKAEGIPEWPPLDYNGPYLHIDSEFRIGENYLEEFDIATRAAASVIGISNLMALLCALIYLALFH